jgi:hypothetical protein
VLNTSPRGRARAGERGQDHDPLDAPIIFALSYALTWKENSMNVSKLVRIAGLSLILAITAMPSFAERQCGCNYCSSVSPTTACNFSGTHTTCGDFLAVTLCGPVG